MINSIAQKNGVQMLRAGRADYRRDQMGQWSTASKLYDASPKENTGTGTSVYILICESGSAEYINPTSTHSRERPCSIGPGEGIIASEHLHIKKINGNQWRLFGLQLKVNNSGFVSEEDSNSIFENRIPKLDRKCTRLLIPHLEEINWEFKQRSMGWQNAAQARFDLLNISLMRWKSSKQEKSIQTNLQLAGHSVRQAHHYFYDHLHTSIRLQEVAKAASVSPKRLIEQFKESGLSSPMSCLRTLRMKKARTLLCQGNLSIKEVALAVGFTSSTVFGRAYKQEFLCTPKQEHYRGHAERYFS